MRSVGLITEYNPFHNGHLYHLQQSRELAAADISVAVMSGNFVQRGEPALCDKWSRTEMALAAGVDLVVELPYLYACNSAPHFAKGAIDALGALGGVDSLCFGSEAGELEVLATGAALLEGESGRIEEATRVLLRRGLSYPVARAETIAKLFPGRIDGEALAAPNNILGLEYLRALRRSGSTIIPLTLKRQGAGYHELLGRDAIASATGIRRMLEEGHAVESYVPPETAAVLQRKREASAMPDAEMLLRLLLARISRGAESLAALYQIEPGQENRLFEAACTAQTLEDLIDAVKARQLTRTRVQRLLCHLLNEVTEDLAQQLLEEGPLYLHLLGASRQGERFLAATRKERSLPLVSNFSRVLNQLKRFYGQGSRKYVLAQKQLQLEVRCSDNYDLLLHQLPARRHRDYFEAVRRTD